MTEIWRAVNRSGFDVSLGFWGFVETVTARRCIDWLPPGGDFLAVVEVPRAADGEGPGVLGRE